MAIKKSVLYSSLWKTCDELRGGMDASQYKDYGLVLLFVKLQCFNGAAVMRLRKGQRRCHYGTRMRRFNGAAVMRLRKGCSSRSVSHQGECFNGAAVMRLRKARSQIGIGSEWCGFNGAAVMRLRKGDRDD